jgi:hypothetical protein
LLWRDCLVNFKGLAVGDLTRLAVLIHL